jgi:hypothetical protein
MNEDNWPGPVTGSASSDEQHVVGVAHVPGLRAILEESTATELPLVRSGDTQPIDPPGSLPR